MPPAGSVNEPQVALGGSADRPLARADEIVNLVGAPHPQPGNKIVDGPSSRLGLRRDCRHGLIVNLLVGNRAS